MSEKALILVVQAALGTPGQTFSFKLSAWITLRRRRWPINGKEVND
jgi:hypothetical protein